MCDKLFFILALYTTRIVPVDIVRKHEPGCCLESEVCAES